MSPGFVGSDIYESYLKSTFDMLYREGGRMMNIPMHRLERLGISGSLLTRTVVSLGSLVGQKH